MQRALLLSKWAMPGCVAALHRPQGGAFCHRRASRFGRRRQGGELRGLVDDDVRHAGKGRAAVLQHAQEDPGRAEEQPRVPRSRRLHAHLPRGQGGASTSGSRRRQRQLGVDAMRTSDARRPHATARVRPCALTGK